MPSTSTPALNRIELQVDLHYEVAAPGADFVFNVHAANTPSQSLSAERLVLTPPTAFSQTHEDPASGNRYLRVQAAAGTLELSYAVTVDLMHCRSDPAALEEVPTGHLPPEAGGLAGRGPSQYLENRERARSAGSDRVGVRIPLSGERP